MSSKVTLICANCGKEFEKDKSEYKRQLNRGATNFYCSLKCSGAAVNGAKKKPNIEKVCPQCGKTFTTTTKMNKEATYCSRECASKASVNEARREAGKRAAKQNFIPGTTKSMVLALKHREAWKYKDVKNLLDSKGIRYEFEHQLNNFIYDLLLVDKDIVIEFDGREHHYLDESSKEENAELYGYKLIRIDVPSNTVIDSSLIEPYI